jgi:hypothetical protein
MNDEDAGQVHPGLEIYTGLAEASEPVVADAFFVPELSAGRLSPRGGTFETVTYCCNTTTFTVVEPPPIPIERDFGAVCELSHPEDVVVGPRAAASDGTEYVVTRQGSNAVSADKDRTPCEATKLVLEAHFPPDPDAAPALGPPRWSIDLPTPAGLEDGGECQVENVRCEISTAVTPDIAGSVQVVMITTKIEDGVNGANLDGTATTGHDGTFPPSDDVAEGLAIFRCCIEPEIMDGDSSRVGTVRAWVDASGHPGFHRQEATAVPDFVAPFVMADGAGNASLDPCELAPEFGCDSLPSGHRAQWLFGDGTTSQRLSGELANQDHSYPPSYDILFTQFLGSLVHYDQNGEVVDKAYFHVLRL